MNKETQLPGNLEGNFVMLGGKYKKDRKRKRNLGCNEWKHCSGGPGSVQFASVAKPDSLELR